MNFGKSKLLPLCIAALAYSSNAASTGQAGEDFFTATSDTKSHNTVLTLAQEREALSDALWTGPLLAPSAGCLPAGHVGASPYLIDGITNNIFNRNWNIVGRPEGTRHNIQSITSCTLGITDWFEVGITPSFATNIVDKGKNDTSLGVGDTSAKVQFALTKFHEGSWTPNSVIAIGGIFPTGAFDNLDVFPSNGLGGGAYQAYIGACAQEYFWMPTGRILSARFGVIYNISQDDVHIKNTSVFGTTHGFRGHADPGNTCTAILGLEYSLTRHWVLASDFLYQHGDATRVRGSKLPTNFGEHSTPVKIDLPSNELFAVAPALEYNWNENWGIIGGCQIDIAGRNRSLVLAPQVAVSIFY